jgi:N-acetylmuramoyl-L-alanine amidase
VRGYRLGDELFLPVERLPQIGWTGSVQADRIVVEAEGKRISLPFRVFSGSQSVPISQALRELGTAGTWDERGTSYRVLAEISRVRIENGSLQIESSLTFQTKVSRTPSGATAELSGVKLSPSAQRNLPSDVNATLVRPGVIRLNFPGRSLAKSPLVAASGREFSFSLDTIAVAPAAPLVVETPKPDPVQDLPPEMIAPGVGPENPPELENEATGELALKLVIEGPSASLFSLKSADGTTPKVKIEASDPDQVQIRLYQVQASVPADTDIHSAAVTAVTASIEGEDTILTFSLSRPCGVEVWSDGDGVQIQILRPDVGDGKLAGKVVVIDPGHGDQDSGAHSAGVSEKNLTLAISKKLSRQLAAQGATVIMTRKTDVFIPLTERAAIANRNKADFFLSVHINSSAKPGMSGSITFFHGPSAVKELLAKCIQREIAAVSGLPNIGAWSDSRIYRSGFSVLRNSKMPGVLLELGFINHPVDRARMVTENFQDAVAKAVVKGLRVFLGDAKSSK